ncbi:dihydrofolate reductase [Curtobacterium sp. MCBD17_023]|uniref:dihydrofolate reductase n=1 Tax=Curtobacterium sp. MCBD17_023 TaxID=2175657 RepID=UPI000D8FBF4D|nr:dihydrofolate reductase [Curtobacterium sp. MCBD17_023]PYY48824.1 dihydrofolate reductase [Curtobacterium sp. MCBD17_023]
MQNPQVVVPRPNVGLIWARTTRGVIGHRGDMPWHLPEDLKHFSEVTRGRVVIMGHRTWDSLPARSRPLPQRRNIVLTRRADWGARGVEVHHDLRSAFDTDEEVWVIGGGQVYSEALPYASRICETLIDLDVPGDTMAPELGREWKEQEEELRRGRTWLKSKTGLRFRFTEWSRR